MSYQQPLQSLTGVIKKVVYTNPQNYWTVMRFETEEGQNVTIVGKFLDLHEGMRLKVEGNFRKNPKYGMEFFAESFSVFEPSTVDGIKEYLRSGLIKGIGPILAERISDLFGEKTIEVFDNFSDMLLKVEGIGKKKLESILKSWDLERGRRSAMIELKRLSLTTSQALKIIENYGSEAFKKVSENPYRLAEDVWGIGFKTADSIALKMGIAIDSPIRIRAGILHVLREGAQDGHCYLPEDKLVKYTSDIIGISEELIHEGLRSLLEDGVIYIEEISGLLNRGVYLKTLLKAEQGVANGLLKLCSGSYKPDTSFIERGIQLIEKSLGFPFSQNQKKAIRLAVTQKITVITGGPGTGKTTIVRAILKIAMQTDRKIALCAPTGRAAKRMSVACCYEAKTIHRLLEFNPIDNSFKRNADNPLDANLIIVDESSMIDILLFNSLLSAMKESTRLVLVGDADQLPSVGPGNLLADIINSGVVPVAILNEIFRQEEGSAIVMNAHRVINGEMISVPSGEGDSLQDFYFIERENSSDVLKTICELVTERIPKKFNFDPFTEIQVICPMHRGEIGTDNINHVLRGLLNPVREIRSECRGDPCGRPVVRIGKEEENNSKDPQLRFREGDKVMQLKNDYEKDVFNGDVGIVKTINKEQGIIIVDFYGRDVNYTIHQLDEMTLAYAMTIHKSQGSEYSAVIVAIHSQHYVMLQRNLLYTAITRGRKLLIIVGNRKAIHIAIQNNKIAERWTCLKERLIKGLLKV